MYNNMNYKIIIIQLILFIITMTLSYFAISGYFGDRDDDNPEILTRKIFWLLFTSVILLLIIIILEILDSLIFTKKLKEDIAPAIVKTD